jgi:hypothetical protein
MSKFTWRSAGSVSIASTISSWVGDALGRLRRDLHRMDDAAEADVRPDDRRLRMALEQRLHLRR